MKTRIRSELHVLACYLVIAVAALVAPVHVANAAEAPVLTLSRSSATYVENDASFYVDASLTITGYTGNISGARVSIDSGYRSTEDSLQFTPSGGISGSFNSSTGILALSGSASASAYETALRSVRYVNNSESPSTANRSITVALSGGSLYYSANGHYYEFVSAAGLSWTAAKSGAASRTLYGLQGYLATITSSGENAFLTEKVSGSAWIGASDAAQEGVWKWMTGPEAGSTLSYSNWSSGEPNNSGGNEDYAHMMSWTSPPGMWNDLPDAGGSGQYASTGYMVEYGGMPGDPTVRLSGTLTVAVQSVNDPPQIVPGSTLTITEDSGTTTRNVIAPTDPDSSVASLTYYIGSPPAKGTASIARRSDGTTGQYAYTPTANANGADSFAWYVSDGQSNSNVVTQSISITAVNDRPSFTKGADQTVLEDCGSQAVAGWATNISAGPADEAVQTLTFTASASNAALFSTQPAIAADGTLTYTPALNASGSATITVTLKDNGGTANGGVDTSASQTFTITVTSVNDSPVIAEGASRAVTMDEDGSPMAFALTLHATDAEGDTIGWSILSNPSHGTAAVGSSTGVVTYAPTANWNGTDSLVVQASDGHGGTAATTVTVTVNPRNDAPVNTVQPVISGTPHPGRTLSVTTGTWDDSVDAPLQGVFSYTYYWQRSSNGGTAWSNINGATTAGTYVVTATDLGCLVRCAVDCKDTQTGNPPDVVAESMASSVSVTNAAPVIQEGASVPVTMDEDGAPAAFALTLHATDADGDTITWSISTAASHGTAGINSSTGVVSYAPAANWNGSDSFGVQASDVYGGTASTTVTITVTPVNDVPSFTKSDNQTVLEDCGSQTVSNWATNISAGPANESSQTLTFTVSASNTALFSAQPAITAGGTLTFTPAPDANGSATITVTLKDNGGTANGGVDTSASQTVTITVTPVIDIVDDAVTTNEDTAITFNAITGTNGASADNFENSSRYISAVTQGSHSVTVAFLADGSITYTPAADWNGTDSFTYTVTSPAGITETATVTITVTPVADIADDVGTTLEDQAVSLPVLANDTFEGSPVITGVSTPTIGSVTIVSGSSLLYAPSTNANGTDSFTYTVTSPAGITETATVTITVTPVNDVPSFTKSDNQTVLEDCGSQTVSNWATNISAGPANESSQTLTFTVSASNTALFSAQPAITAGGTLTFTPAPDANGSATITVTLKDNGGTANGGMDTSASQTVTITVTPVNDVPSFTKSDNQTVLEDCGSQTVSNWATNISAGPANESSQTLTFTVSASNTALFSAQPAITAGGTLTFTPAPDANGSATITVTLKDNGGTANGGVDTSASQTVTITVTPVIDIVDDAVTTNEDTAITFNAITGTNGASADNFENSSRYISAVTQGSHSVTVAFLADGSITYTPAADWNGTDSFTYTVTSPAGITETATVTITVTPVADIADDVGTTLEDQAVSLPVLANDTFEGSPVITGVSTPTIGSVTIVSGSSLLYAPSTNANGTDSFTYTVTSPAGITETATVTITVTPVNDVPSFTKSDNQTVLEDCGSQTVSNWATNISAGPANESSQTLTFTVSASNTALFSAQPAITAGGTLTFTPAPDANGSATITVTLKDNGGTANGGVDTSASQTVTITVTPVNDVPSFTKSDNQTVLEDCGSQTVSNWATNISAGPANESSQTLTFTVSASNTALFSAQPAITAGGTLTFTPAPDANGSATITVTLKDNGGTANGGVDTSASQTVTITVTPVIDIVDDAVTTNEDTAITFNAITGTNGASADNFENSSRYISAVTQGSHSVTVAFLADGSITYTPAADWNGTDSFTYTVTSPAGITETATVTITVTPVADIADDVGTTLEDQAVSLPVLANDTFEGSPVITGVSTPTIGSVTIVSGSSLLYAPSTNANGTDSFTYTVTSPAGITETATVTITVTPVNDVPSFTKSDNQTVLEDCGSQTVSNWATNISAGPANESSQTLTFTVSASNTALFSAQPAITAGGTLTFTPAPDANGSATITVTLKDNGGTANGGVDTSASQTVTITVTPVNDVPSFTKSDNQTVLEDCGSQTVSNWATNISAGPANESSQTLTFTVSASNTALFSAQPAITAGGTLTFTPAPDANGSATITVTLKDNGGTANGGVDTSASQTVTITVTPVIDIVDDAVTTNEDTAITFNAITGTNGASADNFENSSRYISAVTQGSHSVTVAFLADGSITYTPAADWNGTDSFTYTVTSPAGITETATVTITVTPVADIADDVGTTLEDQAVSLPVLANDTFEGSPVITGVSTPTIGSVTIVSGSSLLYAPSTNANGTDSFTYTVTSPAGITETATVTITVTPVNDVPSFTKSDNQTVLEDCGSQTVSNWATNISAGPANESSQTLTFTVSASNTALFSAQPAITAGGTLTFTPAPDANGSATITVTLKDNGGTANGGMDTSASQTVTITVTPVNDVPSFTKSDNQTVLEDCGSQTVSNWATNISAGPANESSQTLTFTVSASNTALFSAQPAITAGGTLTFTPAPDANGSATITVTLKDNGGTANGGVDTSASQTVTITVTPVIDIVDDAVTTNEDTAITFNAITGTNGASADNFENSSRYISAVTQGSHSVTVAFLADGSITYTPAADWNGTDSFTYTVTSPAGITETATVTITVTPVADIADDVGTTLEDQAVSLPVLANDTFEGSPVITGVSTPTIGSVTIVSGSSLLYAPSTNANGTDSFTYTVTSPAGITETATVTITVTPVNDVPSFTKSDNQTVLEDCGSQTVSNWATNISAGPANESSQTLTFTVSASNTALFSAQPAITAGGTLTFTPAPDANGSATITVTLKDNGGTANGGVDTSASQTVTITVTPVNDVPSFTKSDNQTVLEDCGSQTVSNWATNISAGPANESSQTLTFTVSASNTALFSAQPAITAGGTLTFTPAPDANGSATITVTLKDNGGTANGGVDTSASQTVTITVTPVIDIVDDAVTTNEDTAITFNAITGTNGASADNFENSSRYISAVTQGSHSVTVAFLADGSITYTPAADWNGTDSFTYTVTSPAGITETATVTITVTPVADIADDVGTTLEDQAVSLPVLANDTFEGSPVITGVSTPTIGSVTIVSGSSLLYAPSTNANGTDSFTYTVTSPAGITETATVTITVTPVNDVPSFTKSDNQTVLEDCGSQTVSNWATNISAGPANESSQTLTFTVSASNTALFSAQPAITAGGTLTFTPAPDANGSATITVTLKDNGGTANGGVDTSASQTFTIAVTPVNDMPAFMNGPDVTVDEDAKTQTIVGWATNISAGPASEAGQQVAFTVATDNPALFAVQPSLSPAGTLTFTPAPNRNGVAHLTVTLTDDGTRGTAALTTPPQFAALVVNPINDPPVCLRTPAISGKGLVGTLLTADPGSWDDHVDQTPGHVALRIQWLRGKSPVGVDAVPIAGATELTYAVQKQDIGWYLGFQVFAMDDGEGTPRSRSGSAYAPVFIRAFDADTAPPTVVILRDLPVKVSGSTLVLDGLVSDAGSGVRSFSINGTQVILYADGSFHETVPVVKGDNALELTAVDNTGNTWSHTYHITGVAGGTQQQTHTMMLTVGKKTMTVDGHATALDAAPVIREGRTMVPFRAIVEGLGGTVSWNATTRQVTIKVRGQTVVLTIDQHTASVNGHSVSVDPTNARVVPFIASGRTYIPVRFLTERLGMTVAWNAKTQTVTITWTD